MPYDVVSTDEARALAEGNPLSFLHVTRSEIDLPAGTNPYDAAVYARAAENFTALQREAPMVQDDEPSLYLYRLIMDGRAQTGLCGCFSIEEYDSGLIKKHEKTRKDKEDDRTRHMVALRAQTGLVFLTYRAVRAVDTLVARIQTGPPLYDLTAPDGVQHTIWRVVGAARDALVAGVRDVPAMYIADGHHRAASAARVRTALAEQGSRGEEAAGNDAGTFIAVAFPDNQVHILPYNRIVRDLAGHTPQTFLAALEERKILGSGTGQFASGTEQTLAGTLGSSRGRVAMFLAGAWHTLELPAPAAGTSRADGLDVEVLQREVLGPLLKIGDVRTDKRIDFVGGIRGTAELERLVTSGQAAVAFAMHPVGLDDLMAIADAGGIMPPKSTWFEPKLRDGLLVHKI